MPVYTNADFGKRRKRKRIAIIITVIVVLILAVIFYIGITAGSDGERMERISSAVEENTQLKLQIDELNEQIEEMQTEINDLKAQLDARPLPSAEPTNLPASPVPTERAGTSPRGAKERETEE